MDTIMKHPPQIDLVMVAAIIKKTANDYLQSGTVPAGWTNTGIPLREEARLTELYLLIIELLTNQSEKFMKLNHLNLKIFQKRNKDLSKFMLKNVISKKLTLTIANA